MDWKAGGGVLSAKIFTGSVGLGDELTHQHDPSTGICAILARSSPSEND